MHSQELSYKVQYERTKPFPMIESERLARSFNRVEEYLRIYRKSIMVGLVVAKDENHLFYHVEGGVSVDLSIHRGPVPFGNGENVVRNTSIAVKLCSDSPLTEIVNEICRIEPKLVRTAPK